MSHPDSSRWDKIAEEVLGESWCEEEVVERYDLDASGDDVISELLERNVEYCTVCGTWKESSDINPDEQNVVSLDCAPLEED